MDKNGRASLNTEKTYTVYKHQLKRIMIGKIHVKIHTWSVHILKRKYTHEKLNITK